MGGLCFRSSDYTFTLSPIPPTSTFYRIFVHSAVAYPFNWMRMRVKDLQLHKKHEDRILRILRQFERRGTLEKYRPTFLVFTQGSTSILQVELEDYSHDRYLYVDFTQ